MFERREAQNDSEALRTQQESFNKRIQELREFFHGSPDNLFVKGSYVRGDAPYGDIDVMIFNEGKRLLAEQYPEELNGIPISYSTTPLEQLEDYFRICMRSTSGLLETVEIHSNSPEARRIIEEQKIEVIEKRLPDYLLFIYVEEVIDSKKMILSPPGTAPYLKRVPGGKRTASRIFWMEKAMHPELYAFRNTNDLMNRMVEMGYITQDIADDCEDIFLMTKSSSNNEEKFLQTAKRVEAWFREKVLPKAMSVIQSELEESFVQCIKTAVSGDASSEELDEAYNYATSVLVDHQQWMAMFALAANPNTSPETMEALYERYKGSSINRHIIRNLMTNKSFNMKEVDPESLADYPMTLSYYNKRLKMKS